MPKLLYQRYFYEKKPSKIDLLGFPYHLSTSAAILIIEILVEIKACL